MTRTSYITPEGADAEACCIAELVNQPDVDGARWTCPECGRRWRCDRRADEFDEPGFDWTADGPTFDPATGSSYAKLALLRKTRRE